MGVLLFSCEGHAFIEAWMIDACGFPCLQQLGSALTLDYLLACVEHSVLIISLQNLADVDCSVGLFPELLLGCPEPSAP